MRHCACCGQHSKCYSGGEPLAKLCSIRSAQDLNLRSPAPETNMLLLDQLAGGGVVGAAASTARDHRFDSHST